MKRPDTVIISNPRSALNWVRYCIEWFSRCKTPGIRRPVPKDHLLSNDFIICRTHSACSERYDNIKSFFVGIYDENGNPIFKKAILLIRNYKELYARETLTESGIKNRLITMQTLNSGEPLPLCERNIDRYISNIKAYDKFPGEKIHIYYEDLLVDFSQMLKILDFIGIDYDLSDFNLEEHRLKSMDAYNSNRKGVQEKTLTASDPFNFLFHSSKRLCYEHKKTLDSILQINLMELYDKYLSRYKEKD